MVLHCVIRMAIGQKVKGKSNSQKVSFVQQKKARRKKVTAGVSHGVKVVNSVLQQEAQGPLRSAWSLAS